MPPPAGFLADIQKGKKLKQVNQADINDRSQAQGGTITSESNAANKGFTTPRATPAAPAGSFLAELQKRQGNSTESCPASASSVLPVANQAPPPIPLRSSSPSQVLPQISTAHTSSPKTSNSTSEHPNSLRSGASSPSQARMRHLRKQLADRHPTLQPMSSPPAPISTSKKDDIWVIEADHPEVQCIRVAVRAIHKHPDFHRTSGLFVENHPKEDAAALLKRVLKDAKKESKVKDHLANAHILTLAQMVKLYLKNKSEPLIACSLNDGLVKAMGSNMSRQEQIERLQKVFNSAIGAPGERALLKEICDLLGCIYGVKTSTLAYTFGPLLIHMALSPAAIAAIKTANTAVELMIEEYDIVFSPPGTISTRTSTSSSASENSFRTPWAPPEDVSPIRLDGPQLKLGDIASQLGKLRKVPGKKASCRIGAQISPPSSPGGSQQAPPIPRRTSLSTIAAS